MVGSSRFTIFAVRVATPTIALLSIGSTYAHGDAVTISYADLGTTTTTTPGSGLLASASVAEAYPLASDPSWVHDGAPGISALTTGNTVSPGRNGATVGQYYGTYSGGQQLIYNLTGPSNLTEFDFYFGWNGNVRNYAIPVSIYVDPNQTSDPSDAGWSLLTTTDYYPTGDSSTTYQTSPDDYGVYVADATPGGDIATGVQSVEFVFGSAVFNQYNGLDQIDVAGTVATPEPASASLIVLGAIPLLRRRRRVPA